MELVEQIRKGSFCDIHNVFLRPLEVGHVGTLIADFCAATRNTPSPLLKLRTGKPGAIRSLSTSS